MFSIKAPCICSGKLAFVSILSVAPPPNFLFLSVQPSQKWTQNRVMMSEWCQNKRSLASRFDRSLTRTPHEFYMTSGFSRAFFYFKVCALHGISENAIEWRTKVLNENKEWPKTNYFLIVIAHKFSKFQFMKPPFTFFGTCIFSKEIVQSSTSFAMTDFCKMMLNINIKRDVILWCKKKLTDDFN